MAEFTSFASKFGDQEALDALDAPAPTESIGFDARLPELLERVDSILQTSDTNTITIKKILNELQTEFGLEFNTEQKAKIKSEIKERLQLFIEQGQREQEEEQLRVEQEREERRKKRKHRHERVEEPTREPEQESASESHSEDENNEEDEVDDPIDEQYDDPDERKSKKKSKKKNAKISSAYPDWPKKNQSAFFHFSNAMRDVVKSENPTAKITEISRLLGNKWSSLTEEEKVQYRNLSDQDKMRYETELNVFHEAHPEARQWIEALSKSKKKSGSSRSKNAAKFNKEDDGVVATTTPKTATYVDEVLNRMKPQRRRADTMEEGEKVELVKYFLGRLTEAAKKDVEHNMKKEPAVEKLILLPEFLDKTGKMEWQEYLMDEGILKVIRDWLKPLPDGSLPNQKLRTELFRTLNSLPVTQDYLEESGGLGKILTLLAKHPLETEANRKFLKELITKWCRPIFEATTDYRDLAVFESEKAEDIRNRKKLINQRDTELADFANSSRTRIPSRAAFDYAIRPTGIIVETKEKSKGPGSLSDRVMKKFEQKGKARTQQAMSVSVTKPH